MADMVPEFPTTASAIVAEFQRQCGASWTSREERNIQQFATISATTDGSHSCDVPKPLDARVLTMNNSSASTVGAARLRRRHRHRRGRPARRRDLSEMISTTLLPRRSAPQPDGHGRCIIGLLDSLSAASTSGCTKSE